MALFFILQPLLLAFERALGVRRWPAPLARGFTAALLLLASPLFIEPILRIIAA